MGMGGKREGAGRKKQWNSPTKMIRLPAEFEAELIEYAKLLDSGEEIYFEFDSEDLKAEIQPHIDAVVMSIKPSERRAAMRLFKKLIDRL